MMGDGRIRILVSEDHHLEREGLVTLIRREADMEVVAAAGTARQTIQDLREFRPDVGLLDLYLQDQTGADIIRTVRRDLPRTRFLVLTLHDGEEEIFRTIAAGAFGYLLKQDTTPQDLLDAIRSIHAGTRCIPPSVAARFVESLSQPRLTERENEVLALIVRGMTNQDIAVALGVSESTVKGFVSSILRKLGVNDRTQAAITAIRRGIVSM